MVLGGVKLSINIKQHRKKLELHSDTLFHMFCDQTQVLILRSAYGELCFLLIFLKLNIFSQF